MAFEPKNGLVIRYDFLWKTEHDAGRAHGGRDRPCAVVLLSQIRTDGSRLVVACPITHTPPQHDKEAVEIPHKVARHLGLDDQTSWIRTNTVNIFTSERNRIPFGISQTPEGKWSYGMLPYALREQVLSQVRTNSQERAIERVSRDDGGHQQGHEP